MPKPTGRKAAALLLDTLWPNRCDCCDARIPYDQLLCPECTALLAALRIGYAAWAQTKSAPPWDGGAVLFAYDSAARTGVLSMKAGRRGFGMYAAGLLAEQIAALCPPEQLSCVTWVPMTKTRRRMQGFSHSELLGTALAASLGVPVRGDLLEEHAGTIRQHDLPAAERAKYAERFSHTGRCIDGQTVLLVDDILTTGSTLRRCTALLRECGAARVYIAAVCASLAVSPRDDPHMQ